MTDTTTTAADTITDADQLAALPDGSVVQRGGGLYVVFDGSLWNNGLPWSPAEVLRHRRTPVKLLYRPDWPSQAELRAEVDQLRPAPCNMTHTPPMDFAQCETHDETFPLGSTCRFHGREHETWLVYAEEADKQRLRAVTAEAATAAALDLIDDLFEIGDCELDTHGYCRTHNWQQADRPCPHGRAQAIVYADDSVRALVDAAYLAAAEGK